MYFHTWTFLYFFLIVYAVFLAVRRTRFGNPWLLLASYVFYGWWNPWYLILIAYSTWVDYVCVDWMSRSTRRGLWLAVSLVNNLGLLMFYKYAEFLTDNVNGLLGHLGLGYQIPMPDWFVLPVGISFFTFQSMSYTIDYYRGAIEREPSLLRFATYVAFFPQLVAGPIERASSLLPQLAKPPSITRDDWADGLSLFLVGLFKKVALADYLAAYADPIFRVPGQYEAPALIAATVAFAWQIYFDFSGYTDMARGVAQVMGFRLMLNFRHPYLATSLGDFWSRWHISLSSWFRDYVYVPLGGSRCGPWRTLSNLALTMLISGAWHGAQWTYVVWGTLHAVAACLSRSVERSEWYALRVPKWSKQLMVFSFVCLAWIFFRAASIDDALSILHQIARCRWADPGVPPLLCLLVACVWIYQWISESPWRRWLDHPIPRVGLALAMLTYLWLVPGSTQQAFIYFQF